MKKIMLFITTLTLMLSLCACGEAKYSDTMLCDELSEHVRADISDLGGYEKYTLSEVRSLVSNSTLYSDFHAAASPSSDDIGEFGILKADSEEDAKKLLAEVNNYLYSVREERRSFIQSYMPTEGAKLDGARAERYGKYVAYAIHESNTAEAVLDSVKEALKK